MSRSFFEYQVFMIGVGFKNWPAHPYQNYPQVTRRALNRSSKFMNVIVQIYMYVVETKLEGSITDTLPWQKSTSFVDLLCFCSVWCLLCLCARLFIWALWSPAGKGLTSLLSFVVSNCEFVTFPLVSWVRCGT